MDGIYPDGYENLRSPGGVQFHLANGGSSLNVSSILSTGRESMKCHEESRR